MKRRTLDQIVADRAAKRTVVLAVDLDGGEEILIYPWEPAPSSLDSTLYQTARRAAADDRSATVETERGERFLKVFNPAPRLVVVGAVHIAQPLARMAALTGFEVTVVDPRRAFATEARFPGVFLVTEWPDAALAAIDLDRRSALVTLTHDPKLDDPALAAGLHSPAFYIGALGSSRTHNKRLERLRQRGFDDDALRRINGPVGLDIGARSPTEIALAILAQVVEHLRRGHP